MNFSTIDFETYYEKSSYSLSKMTTEEYVRDDQFQVIGVAVKFNDGETQWASGTHKQIADWLSQFPWEESMMIAQNTMFDGFILSDRFGIHAKAYADTMSMAKAIHGSDCKASLEALAERYRIGTKGTEVIYASGKRREHFTMEDLMRYGDYCINDVELTHKIFTQMIADGFPMAELKLIDLTLKMFIRPRLQLNLPMLCSHYNSIVETKQNLLTEAGANKDVLMSNPKFAELLESLGVEPPMKTSLTTGKVTYAFAKTDAAFKALEEHPDVRVQALVSARLGTKSTLEETRTQRFIGMSKRGDFPVPLKYYAAKTGRWGGGESVNLQNLPSRGGIEKTRLKRSIEAPEGYTLIDADSSQIEARVLAWWAGQTDLVEAFRNNEDVYKIMASAIYNKPVSEITESERFVGKATILGAGYGMGPTRFKEQLRIFGVGITLEEAEHIIQTYRQTYPYIPQLWRTGQKVVEALAQGAYTSFGLHNVVQLVPEEKAIRMPSGLLIRYPQLHPVQDENGKLQYQYRARNGMTKIYGGKVVENGSQGIARCIIGEQMLHVAKRYEIVMTVHDAIVCVVPEDEVFEAAAYIAQCMRTTPAWATGLPVTCEVKYGHSYGDTQKYKGETA